jgi:hypothetical protein
MHDFQYTALKIVEEHRPVSRELMQAFVLSQVDLLHSGNRGYAETARIHHGMLVRWSEALGLTQDVEDEVSDKSDDDAWMQWVKTGEDRQETGSSYLSFGWHVHASFWLPATAGFELKHGPSELPDDEF